MKVCTSSFRVRLHFSDRSSPERDAPLLVANEHVTRSILTTALMEDHNWVIYRIPDFMFGDTKPDTDQQLLIGEGQWIFTIEGEKYYLPSTKCHFPLSFFYSVTVPWKMRWSVTWSTSSVHVRILTLNGYNNCGSSRAVLGMHLRGHFHIFEKIGECLH